MDAVTYPNPEVADFIHENLIPVRVRFDAEPLATKFTIKWTPTLVTLDGGGIERHRTVGFLGPEELIPSLLLGIGKAHFENEEFGEAMNSLERIISDYRDSGSAPEAVYLRAVCRYKSSHDPKSLKEGYEKLQAEYPGNEWTQRAYPYRLL